MNDGSIVERELIRRLKRGDGAAAAGLVTSHGEALLRYLTTIVGNRPDAEDAFQETWVRVIDRIASFDGGLPFGPWLFRIARNQAFDLLRRRRMRTWLGGSRDDDASPPEPSACDRHPEELMARQLVGRLLQTMNATQRELLALRFAAELSYEEIAAVCRVPIGTIKSRLHRALDALAAAHRRLEGRTT